MINAQLLDAEALLLRVAERIPIALRANVVVVGSIATAWAFREQAGKATVATKDIDLLLCPAIEAIGTAQTLARELLDRDWKPVYPNDLRPGTTATPDQQLPALRLQPPDEQAGWFVELLGHPQPNQSERRVWHRFETRTGSFALPCFRFMPVAVHDAEPSPFGIRIARPAQMALAHLLEHADPDRTPISGIAGNPPRFSKDVGRAIALWWLANEESSSAEEDWLAHWRSTPTELLKSHTNPWARRARQALINLAPYLPDAHRLAVTGVLAPFGTSFEAWQGAYADLVDWLDQIAIEDS